MIWPSITGPHARDAVELIALSEEVLRQSATMLSRSAELLARADELRGTRPRLARAPRRDGGSAARSWGPPRRW